MKIRKLQLVGGSSFMISLPKDWISRHNLKQGDEVVLREFDEFIVVQPQLSGDSEIKVVVKNVPTFERGFLKRFLGSIYSLGVDKIVIEQEGVGKHITEISDISHDFIGMEVLDCTSNRVVLHIFTIPDFDVVTIIKRMFQILSGIMDEITNNLLLEKLDKEVDKKIHRYEIDFDRLYLLAVRLVNRGMKKIAVSDWDELRFLLGSRIIAKFYEEIADILFILSRYIWSYEREFRVEIHDFMIKLEMAFEKSFDSFISSDMGTIEEYISTVEGLSRIVQDSINANPRGTIVKELLLQICRMLESIGEISFNKCVREMLRQ
ncbi:phosphate signaling complex PhoU family protein [Archaeoglobus neptunius]|uniref:phosphate signaling complex PhoU family protein n=1 Tax=Archaeoglobus neptunius TaxID=2798580 RepID=UPI0019262344|nr:phosphate uptake regulator PhoU [Archaeoglobus neptunius]